MIAKVGLNDCYYITSLVTCRSCEQGYDNEGNPRNDRHGNPRIVDKRPIPLWINECLPRLHEEIYLVDPKIIVTLGGAAAEALVKKPVGVMKESGIERTVEIPGAWQIPVLTEKRKVWVRKHRGEMISPTRTNMVRYLLIPLMRPAFVWDSGDKRPGNVFDRFYRDMKKVAAVYMRLVAETVECATE